MLLDKSMRSIHAIQSSVARFHFSIMLLTCFIRNGLYGYETQRLTFFFTFFFFLSILPSKRKANWIVHILHRNCLLKQVFEGKIKMEVTRRRGRRRKKPLGDLKDRRGYSHLKEETLDRSMWRNRFGGGFGPVVRQNTEWMMNLSFLP